MVKNFLLLLIFLFIPCSLLASGEIPGGKQRQEMPGEPKTNAQSTITEVNGTTKLAYEGATQPLTTTPIVGAPHQKYNTTFVPGTESLAPGEVRVTILGSGDPFVKPSQASASVLMEVGNDEHDFFFFDLGSGALAHFNGLKLPVTATTKVFLTHLHADHVGDMPTLIWSLAKSGRSAPVEVWGPAGETERLGTLAYTKHLEAAHAWDTETMKGHPGEGGARTITTEIPYDKPIVVYERNGVKISSFPVVHSIKGAIGYRLDYKGRSVVFSGDTLPCEALVEACKGGVDLLIHESFPSASVFSKKANVSIEHAEIIANKGHTTPEMAGKIFKKANARMSVMWHLVVDHDTVGPAYAEVRSQYEGPVTIAQDLTVFNITNDSIVTRQAIVDPVAWPTFDSSKSSHTN